MPVITNGCSDNPLDAICCTEFKVGADLSGADFGVDASIKGQFAVLAQAGSDFSATATGMLDDITNACRAIAVDLGAEQAKVDANDKETDPTKKVALWCDLAVARLTASGVASGTLDIQPPQFKCEASVSAKANCQAKCDVSGECNVKANPPKCTGGTMKFECGGKCTAEGNASFSCKGKCDATVKGTCTAQGGVECEGRCEGTCEGSTDSGGNCQGNCKGTCSATKPGVACNGTFEGECNGSCEASGSAKVECSGTCDVEATPLKCEGGTLEGGCQVDVKCDANCDASVSAKASCDVQPFSITAQGAVSAEIEAAIATLKVNLPKLILAVKARGEALGRIAVGFTGAGTAEVVADPGKLGVKGTACAVSIAAALANGAANVTASLEAGGKVTGQLGLN
ncbi:MAG: hypothetical protein KF819_28630 [Labilithrix sp.]|nr:hypothetical protein [Labilithrix sp.]